MRGRAFCPAHVTGFFKAQTTGAGDARGHPERVGSLGAGFSIRRGVTTTVRVTRRRAGQPAYAISTSGFAPGDTRVSEHVLESFAAVQDGGATGGEREKGRFIEVEHEISVPVGYGLGCSGAVALSLAYALDDALNAGMSREEIGRIAHIAEVSCQTGLGDVLASYHGGFEIRTKAGAPGIGEVEGMESAGITAVMICFAPVWTVDFIRDRLPEINGLGGRMVDRLRADRSADRFQDMSLEFARHIDVVTPRMRRVADELAEAGIRCGVALFGETVFSLVRRGSEQEARALEIAGRYGGGCGDGGAVVIISDIDQHGARHVR